MNSATAPLSKQSRAEYRAFNSTGFGTATLTMFHGRSCSRRNCPNRSAKAIQPFVAPSHGCPSPSARNSAHASRRGGACLLPRPPEIRTVSLRLASPFQPWKANAGMQTGTLIQGRNILRRKRRRQGDYVAFRQRASRAAGNAGDERAVPNATTSWTRRKNAVEYPWRATPNDPPLPRNWRS